MRFFHLLVLSYTIVSYPYLLLANITPPSISNINIKSKDPLDIDEKWWNRDGGVEVVGTVNLTADRAVRGLWMNEKNSPAIHLRGNTLTVGEGGINVNYNEHRPHITGGQLTASGNYITVKAGTYGSAQIDSYGRKVTFRFRIDSVIQDNRTHKVGLLISGSHAQGESGQVDLYGNQANTFTGDVTVDGLRNTLHLNKSSGVTAIRGNVYVRNQAAMNIVGSDQITDSSTITLSNRSTLSFSSAEKDIRERVHKLIVERGTSRLAFYHSDDIEDNYRKMLILDDLIINDGALLRISGWQAGRDHLLVRRDSKRLADALKKITIDGWAKNQVYLKGYNDEYYSIEAAPESASYGAILGAAGIGAWHWRRRRRLCFSVG